MGLAELMEESLKIGVDFETKKADFVTSAWLWVKLKSWPIIVVEKLKIDLDVGFDKMHARK